MTRHFLRRIPFLRAPTFPWPGAVGLFLLSLACTAAETGPADALYIQGSRVVNGERPEAPAFRDLRYAVRVSVDAEGRVTDAELPGNVPEGVREVVDRAARQAAYDPATRDGRPVPSRSYLTVTVRYTPQGDQYQVAVTGIEAGGGWAVHGNVPRYPADALRGGYSAQVWTRIVFAVDGTVDASASRVEEVQVRRDSRGRGLNLETLKAEFGAAVSQHFAGWTYLPDEVDGIPLAVQVIVPVRFCAPSMARTCNKKLPATWEQPANVTTSRDPAIRLAVLRNDAAPEAG